MVKTKYNSVNGMTFQTQSQSVDCDIKSCQSEGNGQIDRIYVGNAGMIQEMSNDRSKRK